jgi:hypothetical protein
MILRRDWIVLFAGALVATGAVAGLHGAVGGGWDNWVYTLVFVALMSGFLVVEHRSDARAEGRALAQPRTAASISPRLQLAVRIATWVYALVATASVVSVLVHDGVRDAVGSAVGFAALFALATFVVRGATYAASLVHRGRLRGGSR